MKYICVYWKHAHPDEPTALYSELNAERFEVRKVEVFRDGQCGYASAGESNGNTRLGEVAVPELNEIGRDPQFEPVEITREAFETVWARRKTRP